MSHDANMNDEYQHADGTRCANADAEDHATQKDIKNSSEANSIQATIIARNMRNDAVLNNRHTTAKAHESSQLDASTIDNIIQSIKTGTNVRDSLHNPGTNATPTDRTTTSTASNYNTQPPSSPTKIKFYPTKQATSESIPDDDPTSSDREEEVDAILAIICELLFDQVDIMGDWSRRTKSAGRGTVGGNGPVKKSVLVGKISKGEEHCFVELCLEFVRRKPVVGGGVEDTRRRSLKGRPRVQNLHAGSSPSPEMRWTARSGLSMMSNSR